MSAAWPDCPLCNGAGGLIGKNNRSYYTGSCPCAAAHRAGLLAGMARARSSVQGYLRSDEAKNNDVNTTLRWAMQDIDDEGARVAGEETAR